MSNRLLSLADITRLLESDIPYLFFPVVLGQLAYMNNSSSLRSPLGLTAIKDMIANTKYYEDLRLSLNPTVILLITTVTVMLAITCIINGLKDFK